ncbi:hypothetical protein HID58_047134 [Brassica napus]|uniref:Uncharacterized protein n=1 Tax=Brassica napus TaxID=3708 RepID=A0ABQ8AYF6_BRANA|nr:hypothetical protein HID58_047134 [Brassica napus]
MYNFVSSTITSISIFNNLSHPSSPLLLSQLSLNNDDANEKLWCDQLLTHSQAEEESSDLRVELDGGGGRDGVGFSTSAKEGGEEDATTARWRKKMEERKIWWRRQQRAGPSRGRRRDGIWRRKKKKRRFD